MYIRTLLQYQLDPFAEQSAIGQDHGSASLVLEQFLDDQRQKHTVNTIFVDSPTTEVEIIE